MAIADTLNLDQNTWKSCKYRLKVTIRYNNGTTRILEDSQITGLYIERDFDQDHLPIVLLTIAIKKEDDINVKSDTEFILKLDQYYTEEDSTDKLDPKNYLSDTFLPMDINDTPDSNLKMEQKVRDAIGLEDDDVAMEDLGSETTYILVKKSDLVLSKKMTNGVLKDASMTDAIAYLLSENGCNKLLLSNLTNTTSYSELLLLPMQLLAQLIYLESEYGWHREGTYLFLDFGTFYIIRKNARCTAWRDNEISKVCFCISKSTSNDTVPEGILKTNGIVYFNIGTDQYEIVDASVVSDQVEGNNLLLINSSTGEMVDIESGVTSYDGGAYNIKTYNGHNPYIREQYVRGKLEAENQIQLTCRNGDLGFLTPNKQFTFLTDVTDMIDKIKGNYRLSCLKTSFVKNGGYFDNISIITLKRVEKNITY